MPTVAEGVRRLWRGESVAASEMPPRFGEPSEGVYVAFRERGRRRYHLWRSDGTVLEALRSALAAARATEHAVSIDTLEIDLTHSYRALDEPQRFQALTANAHRGVRGLEIALGGKTKRHAPTWLLASNRSFEKQIEADQRDWSATRADMAGVAYRTFEAEQLLVTLEGEPHARLLERGNIYVRPEDVNLERTRHLAALAIRWLRANLHEDGRMTYLYWPSLGREAPPTRNNTVRQWMATIALEQAAAERADAEIWSAAERNIDHNLRAFYREEAGLGLIDWEEKVKLGAVALAAYAIVNHPRRETWAREEAALRRTVLRLWREGGRFDDFYRAPPGTREQQNFYPGEALLLWAHLYERERDPDLLRRILASFEYYRAWHLEPAHRDPAFVPWHTQAYARIWRLTRDERLASFIVEMNDWLLEVQQWDGLEHRDMQGRFYAPDRPFGPPHASSTGVYLEGLAAAFALARDSGDTARRERYRVAILRGLRSLMQLQFQDEIDLYYVAERDRALGGLRTTVYDNAIRCDNVQHALMAVLEVLHHFGPSDWATGPAPAAPTRPR